MIDLSVFQEPRGFMKVLQFIFVICAFACTCDFRGDIVLTATCPDTQGTDAAITTDSSNTNESTSVNESLRDLSEDVPYSVPAVPMLENEEEETDSSASLGLSLVRTIAARFGLREDEAADSSPEPPVTESAHKTQQFKTTFKYPFKLEKFTASGKNCSDDDVILTMVGNYTSPVSFYVFVGVSAFLYTMMAVALYTYFKDKYELEWVPVVDLAIHFAYTVMWFAGSIAWAVALTAIKNETKLDSLMEANPSICPPEVYCTLDGIKWQLLDFSVVFGFLNFVLYLVNMWFIFKETTFYAKKTHPIS